MSTNINGNREVDLVLSEGQNESFYKIWTKKEAYVKYIGKGLSIPLNSFDVLSGEFKYLIKTINKEGYIISSC